VKDELHTKTVLVARINSDSTDLVKYKKDTVQKRDKVKIITFNLIWFIIKISEQLRNNVEKKNQNLQKDTL
jgi:isocitrate lyase